MSELATYAAVAEIFGGLTIFGGGAYAVIQLREFRARRRSHVAADLCNKFAEPSLARAVAVLKRLPDGLSLEEIQAMDVAVEEAAMAVAMTYETMGLMVHRRIASFEMTQQLAGGLLRMMWSKLERWVHETREQQGNPRFAEWMQWLAERVEEREGDMTPAFVEHRNWQR